MGEGVSFKCWNHHFSFRFGKFFSPFPFSYFIHFRSHRVCLSFCFPQILYKGFWHCLTHSFLLFYIEFKLEECSLYFKNGIQIILAALSGCGGKNNKILCNLIIISYICLKTRICVFSKQFCFSLTVFFFSFCWTPLTFHKPLHIILPFNSNIQSYSLVRFPMVDWGENFAEFEWFEGKIYINFIKEWCCLALVEFNSTLAQK